MQQLRPNFAEDIDAIGILDVLINKIAMEKGFQELDGRVVFRFQIALYQFCRPRLPENGLGEIRFVPPQEEEAYWNQVWEYTGPVPVRVHVQNPGSRYTSLPHDNDYFDIDIDNTEQERIDPPPPAQEPRRPKKKFRTLEKRFENKEFPDKQTFRHPNNEGGSKGTYSYHSRGIVTAQAGLYSSVLAARKRTRKVSKGAVAKETFTEQDDETAIRQAGLVTHILRNIVQDVSYMRYAGLHMANIAIRIAYQQLDQQHRNKFFALFFGKQSQSLWRFFLICAAKYGRDLIPRPSFQQAEEMAYQDGHFDLLDGDGSLNQGVETLKAYQNDITFKALYDSMNSLSSARNVLMVARKIWHHQLGQMLDNAPVYVYMSRAITETANSIDEAFRANTIRNFRSRYVEYLIQRMKQEAQFPLGWPNTAEFVEALVNAVNNEQPIQGIEIAEDIMQAIETFVERMRIYYADENRHFNINTCRLELVKISTSPEHWPQDIDNLVKYLFNAIWDTPLYDGDESTENDEQEDFANMAEVVGGLPDVVQQEIQGFIAIEREVMKSHPYCNV